MSVNVSLRDVDMHLIVRAMQMRAATAADAEKKRLVELIERFQRHIASYPVKHAKATAIIRRLKRERNYSKPKKGI